MARKQYHHGDLKNALIRAGAEILAKEGAAGLTLRKAAQRAGVSHSAPYAHFADKQALVAAISTEGLLTLRARIDEAIRGEADPLARLVATAWETVRFGLEHPDHYRVTFSHAIEQEADHPGYVETAHGLFDALVGIVRACQAVGAVAPGPADLAFLQLWSLVHGLVSLLINRQVPQRVLAGRSPRRLLLAALASHLRIPALAEEEGPRTSATARRVKRPGRAILTSSRSPR